MHEYVCVCKIYVLVLIQRLKALFIEFIHPAIYIFNFLYDINIVIILVHVVVILVRVIILVVVLLLLLFSQETHNKSGPLFKTNLCTLVISTLHILTTAATADRNIMRMTYFIYYQQLTCLSGCHVLLRQRMSHSLNTFLCANMYPPLRRRQHNVLGS